MDLQYWLYIIIGVIYLLAQLRKKPQEQQGELPDFKPESPAKRFREGEAKPPPQKAMTFEELLREIAEAKQPQPVKPVETRQEYVDYDDNIGEEAQDLEDVEYDYKTKDPIYEVFENSKKQAFERSSLEETMKLADTPMLFGKFKEFEIQEEHGHASRYLKDFNDPEELKKAFVMSEILKRKF